jgi:hypothetical protein
LGFSSSLSSPLTTELLCSSVGLRSKHTYVIVELQKKGCRL